MAAPEQDPSFWQNLFGGGGVIALLLAWFRQHGKNNDRFTDLHKRITNVTEECHDRHVTQNSCKEDRAALEKSMDKRDENINAGFTRVESSVNGLRAHVDGLVETFLKLGNNNKG